MRTHGRNKRSRTNKDPDGDTYMNNNMHEDLHPDAYSRSHSSLENYRTPSTSTRTPYIQERDRPPRSHRGDDWNHTSYDHDRYTYVDPYARAERLDDYDDGSRRNGGSWGTVDPGVYPASRHDWPQHYDLGSTSSYAEPSAWGPPAPVYDAGRSGYAGHWPERDTRDLPVEDWDPQLVRNDHGQDRRQDWRHDGRREKGATPKFQSDSGWSSRRRDRDWASETSAHHDLQTDNGHSAEDRSWEPAASWKSSNRNNQQQPNQHQRGQNGQRSNGKTKRSHNQNKQRKDWRQADDGDLNNWTRREPGHNGTKVTDSQHPPKRKHARSLSASRSRSRSPAESFKSHRSSRGRSRSPSFSPASKRRRRDDSSPITLRSRTPSERGGHRSNKNKRYFSRTPSPQRSPSARRSNRSHDSSSDSERSPSRSPTSRTRSLHRLPTLSQATITSNSFTGKISNNGTNRKSEDTKNGKSRGSRRKGRDGVGESGGDSKHVKQDTRPNKPPPSSSASQSNSHSSHPISISMPPPSIPPTHTSLPRTSSQNFSTSRSEPNVDAPTAKSGNSNSSKGPGFKPIGKASSAVKKFFPGDEEDMDLASDDQSSTSRSNKPSQPSAPSHGPPTSDPWTDGDPNDINVWPPPGNSVEIAPGMIFDVPLGPWVGHDYSRQTGYWPRELVAHRFDPMPSDRIPHLNGPAAPLPSYGSFDASAGVSIKRLARLPSPPSEATSTMSIARNSSPRDQDVVPEIVSGASAKDLYSIVNQVGEGTFGKVYKARNTLTGRHVALKRIRMESERDGFPVTAMREIKLLQSLRHENVVRLYEMMVSKGSVFMVFEYMDHDLTGILSQSQFTFSEAHLKSLCHQMLAGLAYLHHKGVIHRDIKGSNILVNSRGELKLADFGLARFYQKRRRADYTNRVITLWYRPPELLFGATVYGPEVDMWSAGCIMLELYTKKQIFQGNDEIHQVDVVFKLMGTPTPENWPDVLNLPWYELVKPQQTLPNRFRDAFQKWLTPAGLDLAEQLLAYDPSRRITAVQAMNAPYFVSEAPAPAQPVGLIGVEGEWHELETKRERAKRKERKTET